MQSHEHFMQIALKLAARGTGCTSPNPLVGSVVVRDGTIIGEGWHEIYGHHHAEVNALQAAGYLPAASEQSAPTTAGATLYVTLEPCHHHGLTPPCTQAIIDAGITRVVYALADPNPKAAGGAQWLEAQGVEVISGVLEEAARFQNRFFLQHVLTHRPYVIAKSATSLDGRTATRTGNSQWITGPEARQRGHQLRQAVDAIVVGADTVVADNPALTVRLPEHLCAAEAIRHPRPVILDSTGRVPLDSQLLNGTLTTRTLVATTDRMDRDHRRQIEARGFEVISLPDNPNGPGVDPHSLLDALGQRSLHSILIEGGATIQGSFRDARLIDEVWTFLAPRIIGGEEARPAYAANGSDQLDQATQLHDVRVEIVGSDVLIRGCVVTPDNVNLCSAAEQPPTFLSTSDSQSTTADADKTLAQ